MKLKPKTIQVEGESHDVAIPVRIVPENEWKKFKNAENSLIKKGKNEKLES